ncbi:MAG TPA: hypothetical protein VFV47_02805 [Hyphomicrobiaceae bacterium]|nr:hypothetical protein [Hyphomicrobiaceae bacterium]
MVLLPPSFTSEWSLIVPGAGAETRISLDRIGQAQSSTNSPFSDKVLSPKVNYKEIAESVPVMEETARLVGIDPDDLKEPKIKLVDQTSILLLKISARTAEEAQGRAWAHFKALRARLDFLREDEIRTKNNALRANITEVEIGLKQARNRLIELQAETGLSSLEQYNQLIAAIETMRRENAGARAALAEKRNQVEAMRQALGVEPDQAAAIVRLSTNPELRKLALAYATTSASHAELLVRFGSQHPRSIDLRNKLESVTEAIAKLRPEGISDLPSSTLVQFLPSDNDRYVVMLGDYVARNAELYGQIGRIAELEASLQELDHRRERLGMAAAKLDDLQRDHLIANAVFSSALARLDAGKSEQFASYPVLQMMSEPTRPERPSSPRLLFAILGAVGGSLLSCLGWLFAWMHQWFLFRRLESRFRRTTLAPA